MNNFKKGDIVSRVWPKHWVNARGMVLEQMIYEGQPTEWFRTLWFDGPAEDTITITHRDDIRTREVQGG